MEPILYTVEQLAEILGRSKDWVWAQCRADKIPHHKFIRSYRFTADDLKQLLAQTAVVPFEPVSETLLTSKAERRLRRPRSQ